MSTHESHPTWVRGLKPKEVSTIVENAVSHPTWVRGLKHQKGQSQSHLDLSRTLRGCVD